MPYGYNKLRGRIIEKYGSLKDFASETKISYIAVINKMQGKTRFNQVDMSEWSKLLDIPPEEYSAYFFT